jgi:hypothetical protein
MYTYVYEYIYTYIYRSMSSGIASVKKDAIRYLLNDAYTLIHMYTDIFVHIDNHIYTYIYTYIYMYRSMSAGIASVKKDASRDLLNDAFNMKQSAGDRQSRLRLLMSRSMISEEASQRARPSEIKSLQDLVDKVSIRTCIYKSCIYKPCIYKYG